MKFKVGDFVVARKGAPGCLKPGVKLEVKQWGDDPIDLYVECAAGQHYLGLTARHFDPYVPVEDMVYVTKQKYDQLVDCENFLGCLEAFGIDNWDGWDDACKMHGESKKTA